MTIIADVLLVAAGLLVIAVSDRRALTLSFGVLPLAVVLLKLEAGASTSGVPGLLAPLIAGLTAAAVLALCVDGRAASRRPPVMIDRAARPPFDDVIPFALLCAVLIALGAFFLAVQNPIFGTYLTFAIFWLVGTGLYTAMLATDPYKLGIGLMLILTGLGVVIGTLEVLDPPIIVAESLLMICVALVVAYLTQASEAAGENPQ